MPGILYIHKGMVVCACKEAQFGKVWGDDVGPQGQFPHLAPELFGEHGVSIPVVSHDRVYEKKSIFAAECIDKPVYMPDLHFTGDKPGVYAVEPYIHFIPFGTEGFHFVCIVVAEVAGISCLCTENCRRQRTRLYAHGGGDGDGGGERTAAKSG